MTTYTNFGQTSIAAPVGSGDATATVADATKLPAAFPYWLTVTNLDSNGLPTNPEIMSVTGAAANVLNVTRAQQGTTAQAHVVGEVAANVLTKADMIFAQSAPAVANSFVTAYDSTTGLFIQVQPQTSNLSDISTFNLNTSGTGSIGNLNLTSSTRPTNGIYLSATNTVSISTNSIQQMIISPVGFISLGSTTEASGITINTNMNGGITLASSNTGGPAFNLNASGGGGHNIQFFSAGSGSGNPAGSFGTFDSTLGATPWALFMGTSSTAGARMAITSTAVMGFSNSSSFANAIDTGISRTAAGAFAFGTGAVNNAAATLAAASATLSGFLRLTSAAAPSQTGGEIWNDSTQVALAADINTNVIYPRGLIFIQTATTTITNTSVETSIYATGIGSRTLAANTLTPGKVINISGGGTFASALTPGNLTIKVKLGTVTLATAVITNILASQSAGAIQFSAEIVCRTKGATGTVMINGNVDYDSGVLQRGFAALNNAGATSTIDTTASQTLDVTATYATASTSNTLNITTANVEIAA